VLSTILLLSAILAAQGQTEAPAPPSPSTQTGATNQHGAAAGQKEQGKGSKNGATVAPDPKQKPAPPKESPPKGSYLIAVIDLRQLDRPCVQVVLPADAPALIAGQESSLGFTPVPEVHGQPAVTVNGAAVAVTQGGTNDPTRFKFTFTPAKVGPVRIVITSQPPAGKRLTCSNPVEVSTPALAPECGHLQPKLLLSANPFGKLPDAGQVKPKLGAPLPLTLDTQGSKILVYSPTASPSAKANQAAVDQLKEAIRKLIDSGEESEIRAELPVNRHLTADSLAELRYDSFDISLQSPGLVQVTSKKPASCRLWRSVLEGVEQASLGETEESPVSRLYYLKAADKTAAAINGVAAASPPPAAASTPPAPGGGSGGTNTADKNNGQSANGADGKTPGNSPAPAGNTTAKPPAPDPSKPDSNGSTGQQTQDNSATQAAQEDKSKKAPAAPVFTAQSLEQDLLVYGGDDKKIQEAKRILALLDLPRPEMIINAWILQATTTDAGEVARFDDIARRLVAQNNDELQQGIGRGWKVLHDEAQKPNFFDEDFYRYLAYRYVGELPGAAGHVDAAETDALREAENTQRKRLGVCKKDEYCLGYISLFSPLKPRLTDLLLAIVAANEPVNVTEMAVDASEGTYQGCRSDNCDALRVRLNISPTFDAKSCKLRSCGSKKSKADRKSSKDASLSIVSTFDGPDSETEKKDPQKGSIEKDEFDQAAAADANGRHWSDCGKRDLERLVNSAGQEFLAGNPPQLQLECFRSTVERLFEADMSKPGARASDRRKPSPAQALARAALADFLFNYKVSQTYPHDFSPYELTQSADGLNTALSPFIDAFNRDVSAFQDYLNTVVSMAVDCKRCGKATFTNSGLVSVRTVSTNPAEVSSTTQSFLDATTAPDIGILAANILGGQPGGGTGANAPAAAGVLQNLSFNEAQVLMGALKSYQSSEAQIGRAIDLKVTPRALSGASSAEMDITLKVDDAGTPTRYTGTTSQNFNLSRVATHDTTTHVRVDSLKLFEVSAVGAHMTLSRPPFPLILPAVELPFIGSIVGLPRKPAEEFHSSVAIMSALVVPTAADLANGLEFVYDRVIPPAQENCNKPWTDHWVPSEHLCAMGVPAHESDLGGSITTFHRLKRQCFATGGTTLYPLIESDKNLALPAYEEAQSCDKLTFNYFAPPLGR
jgi:hypothetical protein